MAHDTISVELNRRFRELWARCAAVEFFGESDRMFQELADRYCEPHRHYHDFHHIGHCLAQLDRARDRVPEPDAVEFALWYHDVIYEPGSRTNEKDSADLFLRGPGACLNPCFAHRVSSLILATIFGSEPADANACYMVDIDLSSFGLDWDPFLRDSRNVRRERPDLDDTAYAGSHGPFLLNLLDRPAIFRTDFFRKLYEETARRNIQRLLTERPVL